MRRALSLLGASLALLITAGPALACGGLIGPNGAVNLLRTTTFAGYADGVEHYVTAFEFAGGGGAFGSITPLPAIPTKVERGGDWTLQRLALETSPRLQFAGQARLLAEEDARSAAEVILETRIDALDITILRGGGDQVGAWATEHGFRLPPDAPEVLDFYAERSPIFMAASFDARAAERRGQAIGDGTPVHLTIPTDNPWVPLRILALGKTNAETVEADVFLLTERRPTLLPAADGPFAVKGLSLGYSAGATSQLLADLRSDKGMKWVPDSAWLSKVVIDARASDLRFDLAIDPSGHGVPSLRDAGLAPFGPVSAPGPVDPVGQAQPWLWLLGLVVALPLAAVWLLALAIRSTRRRPIGGV